MWIITNKSLNHSLNQLFNHSYYVLTDEPIRKLTSSQNQFMFFGYILPKHHFSIETNGLSTTEMLDKLYSKYKDRFIDCIKGNFILIHLQLDTFKIYSDHFGIKKFFYWKDSTNYIISDDLKEITSRVGKNPSADRIGTYVLTYHFTNGYTIFNNIYHNKPSETISLNNGKLESTFFWQPTELIKLQKKKIDIEEISESLSKIIEQYLYSNENQRISLSLTGGADTRNVLALFLKKLIHPHLYTYGNPMSADCKKAATIANGLGLSHTIHDIQMDPSQFQSYARKIIRQSGGLASIHRVHRLLAIENERKHAELMFTGTLGGEYVKGVDADNYITSSIIYDNWGSESISTKQLTEFLQHRFVRTENINIQSLLSWFLEEPYMKGSVIERKHNTLCFITAHLHDAQDINLYNSVFKEIYTPFLDIDYLEMLFSSSFSFDNKEILSRKWIQKLQNPVYASRFLQVTFPPLLKYSYTGEHKPSEVLFNKYLAAILRISRKKTTPKYPQNFPLSEWMMQFVENNLLACNDYQILKDTFDIESIIAEFYSEKHVFNESHWLKYTNPIMMRYILDEFN